MPQTNRITADAATQSVQTPLRPMSLIGVFQSPEGDHILMQSRNGSLLRLELDTPQDGLILKSTGEGWAMVVEGDEIHRLVIG